MTVENLHDALTLLPGDLITAVDRVRTAPKTKVIRWRRWASLAAVLVLVVSTGLVFQRSILPGMGGAKMESIAQAPAAAAPMENGITGDTAFTEAPAAEAPAQDSAADEKAAEEELYIDHAHRFAEETETSKAANGYCGNMMTTVYLNGTEYSFAGSDSVAITDILLNLPYDPNAVCRCMAEFTVDTELLTGIEVNLTEGFARCEKGQAALTEKQAEIIQEIIRNLE